MKTQKRFRLMALSVIVLGLIHICAFPFVIGMVKPLDSDGRLTFSFMFLITGVATVFAGWIQLLVIKKMPLNYFDLKILKSSVAFMAILGIGAIASMLDNPFAAISLLIALYEIYLIRKLNGVAT